jgi:hypothetical protein
MPKVRTFYFTKPTELHGILITANWAKSNIRDAINLGTGPWFCICVDGKFKAAVEMSSALVGIGFKYAYEFAKSEPDARTLAQAAYRHRKGEWSRDKLDQILSDMQQKYGRNFESRALIVARRLADANPCAVASAVCIDAVGAPHDEISDTVLTYAQKLLG